MNTLWTCGFSRLMFAALVAAGIASSVARADYTAVVSRVFNGYTHARLPDGTLKTETYALGDAGRYDGQVVLGDSIDSVSFLKIAQLITPALADQHYAPSSDPNKTDLMILLVWGTTKSTRDKPMAYRVLEEKNAQILGFTNDLNKLSTVSFSSAARDLREQFEDSRYFVVLKAYDFQTARKEKKLKILWETRFSIARQGNDFVQQLPLMAQYAAQSFGRETNGLMRPELREGTVEIGEAKVVPTEEKKD